MKLETHQKKILIMAGVVLGVILIFLVFIYAPRNRILRELKLQLNSIQKNINEIKRLTGDIQSLDLVISKYNDKLKQLKEKLPAREESTIRELGKKAAGLGIEVMAINPEITVDTKLPVRVKGCQCRELGISMELRAPYKKLAEYIKILQEDFPALIKIEKLKMIRLEGVKGNPLLQVSMEITMYLITPD